MKTISSLGVRGTMERQKRSCHWLKLESKDTMYLVSLVEGLNSRKPYFLMCISRLSGRLACKPMYVYAQKEEVPFFKRKLLHKE